METIENFHNVGNIMVKVYKSINNNYSILYKSF